MNHLIFMHFMDLPLKAQALVKEWLQLNTDKLQKMWEEQKIEKLPPLE